MPTKVGTKKKKQKKVVKTKMHGKVKALKRKAAKR
jgi:hypothetical protein